MAVVQIGTLNHTYFGEKFSGRTAAHVWTAEKTSISASSSLIGVTRIMSGSFEKEKTRFDNLGTILSGVRILTWQSDETGFFARETARGMVKIYALHSLL